MSVPAGQPIVVPFKISPHTTDSGKRLFLPLPEIICQDRFLLRSSQ